MNGVQWIIFGLIIQIVHFLGTWKLYKAAGEAPWKAIIPVYNAIIFFKISIPKKIFSLALTFIIILSLYIFGNYEINKNNQFLNAINKKVYVKIVSPSFDLEYGLNQQEIKSRLMRLIKYSKLVPLPLPELQLPLLLLCLMADGKSR